MKKYVKKPIEVEAVQLTRKFADVIINWIGEENIGYYNLGEFYEDECVIDIQTLEGIMTAQEGDFIVKGVKGEFYPVKADIFKLSYDMV